MSPPPALLLQDVTRRFGRVEALRGISFQVGAGEFVGLIGHNGAGKSTAIRVMTGQIPPSSGRAEVTGLSVADNPRLVRARVGYAPENPVLYEYLTAREFLSFIAEVRSASNLEEALDVADLGADADRLIREYSQGMRRRTALAAAVLGRPPVLVLDEALNGLDPPSAARVKGVLARLCAEGHAVLLSTHVLETVERVASRVVMLAHGRIVADEPVARLGTDGLERLFLTRIAESRNEEGASGS